MLTHADDRGEPQDGQHVVDAGEPVAGGDRRRRRTSTTQRDDQAEVAARPTPEQDRSPRDSRGPVGDRLDPGALVGGRCGCRDVLLAHAALPSMTRSSTPCSSMLGRRTVVEHPAVGDHQDPVGQAEHLLDLAGDDDDGDARRRRARRIRRVDLGAGADVDAAGGLVEQQHPACRAAASGRARPSAGCRRTACGRRGRGRPAARRAPSICSRRPCARRRSSRNAGRGEPGEGRQRDVPVDRLVEEQALALALLRAQPDAGADRGARPTAAQRASADRTVPAVALRAPKMVSRISERPEPTSPASPTTSPARTSNETSSNVAAQPEALDLEHDRRRPSATGARGGKTYSMSRPVISRISSAVGVSATGRPVATVRPSLSTVIRSPIWRISSSRCEM